MKPTVLNSHKFTLPKQLQKCYPLLCTASVSIFWVMFFGDASSAQVNPYNQQASDFPLGEGGLLPVPQSPVPSKLPMPGIQTVPPPPGSFGSNAISVKAGVVAPRANPFSKGVQQTPTNDIKQLENGFIRRQMSRGTTTTPTNAVFAPQNGQIPLVAAGGDTSSAPNFVNTQAAPLPPPPNTTVTQEFTAPTTPTYNQLLNAQPQVAPLPPLPGTTARQEYTAPTAPTYNQLPSSQPRGTSTPAPTFNQLLNSQVVTPPSGTSTPAPTFNQLPNSQVVTPPSGTSTPGQTYNQLFNCQVVTSPSGTGAPGQTYNQLLNCQAVTSSSGTGTLGQTYNQPLNSQGVTPPSGTSTIGQTYNQPLNSQTVTPQFTDVTTAPQTNPVPVTQRPVPPPLVTSAALREPSLQFQGVYLTQGDQSSARARLTSVYPVSPQALFGATLDLTSENSSFDDSRGEGLSVNELYFATSLSGLPNLRFVVGQLDLTSYFDRNSFAKDGASQFFNPVFQTNPALAATGIASRTGLLVNWSATDNIEAKAAVFSSADRISDFAFDGFAGEIAIRFGNAIIRGTYASDRDAGVRDTFPESFGISRNPPQNTVFGPQKDDREEAYGLNAEVFIPNLKLGIFGRYGRYENRELGEGADTYIVGASLLDLFTRDDKLGLAYGRALSNDRLRRGDRLDVAELYYDFQFLPNLRLGFTIQARDGFEETVLGIRVRSEFDIFPRGRVAR